MDALGFRAVLEVILSEYILDPDDAIFWLLTLCSSILMLSSELELLSSQATVTSLSELSSKVITSVVLILFEESVGLFSDFSSDLLDPDHWVLE